jgi:acid phosphatase
VIGDQGLGASGVAAGLSHVANIKHPNAILGVGDHVYAHGAEGSYDKLVSRFIEKFITDPDLGQTLHVPWYMVTGNHDWESDASWERSFTDADENEGGYWRMPDFWYKQQFLADGFTVDVFFIDTQVWINSDDDRYYHRASLGAGAKQDQLDWLTAQLGESTAQWKIVVGHHPMYSQGNKGMTDELHPDLEPLMREHGVQIYFSGHSHNQQLIQFDGMNYVISGAGVVSSDGVKTEYPEDAIISKHVSLGFAGLSVCSSSESALIFYDGAGAELASHTFPATPPQPSAGTPCLANGDYCE